MTLWGAQEKTTSNAPSAFSSTLLHNMKSLQRYEYHRAARVSHTSFRCTAGTPPTPLHLYPSVLGCFARPMVDAVFVATYTT